MKSNVSKFLVALAVVSVGLLLPELASATGLAVAPSADITGSFTDIRTDVTTIGGAVILVGLTVYGIRVVKRMF